MLSPADLDLFPPGVRLIGGRRRAPLRGVLHDVAGFVGVAERGPMNRAVRVEDVAEFENIFGGPVAQGFLAPSMRLFFENGGRAAWIVRVTQTSATRARLFLTREGSPMVKLGAGSPGRWGNAVQVRIEPTSADRFTLRVAVPGRSAEIWPRLSLAQLAKTETRPQGFGGLSVSLDDAPVAPVTFGGRAGSNSSLVAERADVIPQTDEDKVLSLEGFGPVEAPLSGGTDGVARLSTKDFGADTNAPVGLKLLEEIDEVALLAVPDLVWQAPLPVPDPLPSPPVRCEAYYETGPAATAPVQRENLTPPEDRRPLTADERDRVRREMMAQARRQGDRMAILDCEHASDLRRIFDDGGDTAPGRLTDGEFGALYFPWVETAIGSADATLPPSGAIAGIYARTTLREGPHIAPANELLEAITGLAYDVTDTEHASLNGDQVNVLRRMSGRGLRVMGARTRRTDGPFRQVAIRRLVNFILETLDEETQWLVFEPNDSTTRGELERVVRGFLDRIWRQGMLDGARPEDAYSVTAGPAVNPRESIDAGRLVCELAVRPPWPAEWIRLRLVKGESGLELAGFDAGLPPQLTGEA